MIECPRCFTKIQVQDNRLPPWCPQCGTDLKSLLRPAAPASVATVPNPGTAPSPPVPEEKRLDTATVQRMLEEIVGHDPSKGPPVSRVYQHTCGAATRVSGDDYVLLECPFRPVDSTICAGCKNYVPLDSVRWEDTG